MKRKLMIILSAVLVTGTCFPQSLPEIYKKGPVKLIPEVSYGTKNNWNSLFRLYYDTLDKDVARRWNDKRIIVAPDGSVFMSHKNRHEIWKFGPDGTYLKSFGMKGGKATQFPMLPSVQPVVDGKYVFTTDVNARLKFFDLDGNYYKSITLKYMTGSFQPVGNGEILLTGNVLWRSPESDEKYEVNQWRRIVVRLNIHSGEEKIIYSFLEDPDFKFLKSGNPDSARMVPIASTGGKIYLPGYRFFKTPEIILLEDGRFLLMNRGTGDVRVYDRNGKESGNFMLDITPLRITEKDALENFEANRKQLMKNLAFARMMKDSTKISRGERGTTPGTVIKAYPQSEMQIKNSEKAMTMIDKLKDVNGYYPTLPYFSNVIRDSDGNILVFEFTAKDQEHGNIFNVVTYDRTGQKLARTSFVCDEYDLNFSADTFVIHDGYVYAIARMKNISGMPLRLVKFRMSGQN